MTCNDGLEPGNTATIHPVIELPSESIIQNDTQDRFTIDDQIVKFITEKMGGVLLGAIASDLPELHQVASTTEKPGYQKIVHAQIQIQNLTGRYSETENIELTLTFAAYSKEAHESLRGKHYINLEVLSDIVINQVGERRKLPTRINLFNAMHSEVASFLSLNMAAHGNISRIHGAEQVRTIIHDRRFPGLILD